MTPERFDEEMARVLSRIDELPPVERKAMLHLAQETRERAQQIRDSVARAVAALDDWRLVMKYRIFDAEATAREAGTSRREGDA